MTSIAERYRRALAAAVLALACACAHAQTPPDALVKDVTLEVMGVIAKDKDLQSNRARIIALVEAKVLPHFNFQSMTALAMGRNWSKATPQQKQLLTDEFKTLLVRTYASALAAYRDQKFEFRPLRAAPTDTDVTVHVRVLQPGASAVTIDYGMEKTAAGWKVYDVAVGGVSLVANYRNEFNLQVRDAGVDGLIKSLRSKNSALERTAAGPAKQ